MSELTLRIAEVATGHDARFPAASRFSELTSLLQQPAFDVVVLSATDAENLAMLQALRRQPAYRLSLIYCSSQAPLAAALGDGPHRRRRA